MVMMGYIACVLLAVMNTWYLTTQLKFKKELAVAGGSPEQLKETRITIGLCMFIYLVDIMFAAITAAVG
jgi:ABC-type glucose/galactose transport system permease subunit